MFSEPTPPTPPTRVPLVLPANFSWQAVALVIAEKFGLRGLRIAFMIAAPVMYFAAKGCASVLCSILYVGAGMTVLLFVLVVWTAKEALDKFAREHASHAWLVVDAEGIGGESQVAGETRRFKLGWDQFKRIKERNRYWLLETRSGSWMVLPTHQFTAEAWAHMRAHRTP
ncbi:MAG: YcxB family protein [Burkholderiales bacterium]|jgi:hypothetical protein|nr:YcxB family protein [Nitrosomonadaceae bacterium]